MHLTYEGFAFHIKKTLANHKGRVGVIDTPHGVIETPNFIFCATKAAIRTASMQQMSEEKTQCILANTYHLMIQPGIEILKKCGGLARFTAWCGPTLTDSGGFQIFSLGHGGVANEIKRQGHRHPRPLQLLEKITEEGAYLKSYVDGKRFLLSPEKSIEIQSAIGADIILALDECTPFHVDKTYTERSMHMSNRWARRSMEAFQRIRGRRENKQALYGVVQGGVYPELRLHAAHFLNDLPLFGYAIGGSLGKDKQQMQEVVATTAGYLRQERPKHLLGIGGIEDIWMAVAHGIDTFDCVSPTRIARHGWALVRDKESAFRINLKNATHRDDQSPLQEECLCQVCQGGYSRSYLHHLVRSRETVAMNFLTLHNVHFMNVMMLTIRRSIFQGSYWEERKKWIGK